MHDENKDDEDDEDERGAPAVCVDGEGRTLTRHDLRRVGVAAGCDPRTVSRFCQGEPQHSTTRARVERALRDLGFTPPEAPPARARRPRAMRHETPRTHPKGPADAPR